MTKREAMRQVLNTLMSILTRGSIVDSDDPEVIDACHTAQLELAAWIATKKKRAMGDARALAEQQKG